MKLTKEQALEQEQCTHDWEYMEEPYSETMKCNHCETTQR